MHLQQSPVDDRAGHRGDVDDRSIAARQHHPRLDLAGQKHAADIDAVELVPGLQRQGFGGMRAADARIVDGDGQRAEFLLDAIGQAIAIGLAEAGADDVPI